MGKNILGITPKALEKLKKHKWPGNIRELENAIEHAFVICIDTTIPADDLPQHILDGVGSTEMLHIFLSNVPGDVVYGTSGVPVPGYDVRLVDEHDADVADGEVGEMLVKGETAANAYWNQREKSRRTFLGEWTRTGDNYILRGDGRYIYCGRTDEMMKVSGIWVETKYSTSLKAEQD